MSSERWEVLETISGTPQAEILAGLLKAQGIPVTLSQEGISQFSFVVTVGPLGEVQILVPSSALEQARQILDDYRAGAFEDTPPIADETASEEDMDEGTDQGDEPG